jgi:thiamine biosynthesis lipoprotein
MGTRLDALLFGEDPAALNGLWHELTAETVRLERLLSRHDTESALYRINRDAVLYPVSVDEHLWPVLLDCRRYFEQTNGWFDVTLGYFDNVELDESTRTVFLKSGKGFDLGGYAKGYALRRVRQLLAARKMTPALVNFGDSTILAVGAHPHGDCWPVGIDNPYSRERMDDFRLRDVSLSVSGNMPSHPQHIVNPQTGRHVTARKITAVTAGDPVDAEVLTTALMVAADDGRATGEVISRFSSVETYKIYNC